MVHDLMFSGGVLLGVGLLAAEGVEDVAGLAWCMASLSMSMLLEHGLVCDVPPHSFIDDDLCSEDCALQAVSHVHRRRPGPSADEQIYG
jgi:hypothetical protein